MRIELRGNTLVVTGTNIGKGRYDFSESALKYLAERNYQIPLDALARRDSKLKRSSIDLSGYPYKTNPWPYQRRGQELALSFKKFMLVHAMGAGKSKTLLDIIGFLFWKGLISKALIACPLSVLQTVWPIQFGRHSSFGHLVVIDDVKKGKEVLSDLTDRSVVVVNYDKLISLEKEIAQAGFGLIAGDESSKLKNPAAKRTKVMARLAGLSEYTVLMTGTPVSKNLVDIFGQYLVMDPYWLGKSRWFFQQRYCIMGGWMQHQIVGYQREDELRRIISIPSHTVTVNEALPYLPPKSYQDRLIRMEPEQTRIYKETKKKFLVELANGQIDIKNAASRAMKLQEIADGFVIDDEERTVFISSAKVNGLMEAFEEIEDSRRITVWCRFRENIRMITEAAQRQFPDRPVLTLHGGVKDRATLLEAFRDVPGSVLVAQIQTGGMGIDLTCSSAVFFFSNVYEYALRDQAESRHHRPGQECAVTYGDILMEGTVDLKIKSILSARKNLSEWLMEGKGRLRELFSA